MSHVGRLVVPSGTSYDVKLWKIHRNEGKRGATYAVRWTVGGRPWRTTFKTLALAQSFEAELRSASRRGEAFDIATGRPVSMLQLLQAQASARTWYEHACAFVDMKWSSVAGSSRRSIADSLATVTPAFLQQGTPTPPRELRRALYDWAFNAARRRKASPPEDLQGAIRWVARNTVALSELEDPSLLRSALDTLASKLDGTPAAATTLMRKRAILHNALEYAVELGDLPSNPLLRVKWTAPKVAEAVDPRVLVDRKHAEAMLSVVKEQAEMGPRLVAFFACMYYAAMRPSEVADLRRADVVLPALVRDTDTKALVEPGAWGEFHLNRSSPALNPAWNESGTRRESRQLKHRAKGEVRVVPCHPRLVALLRHHIETFGTSPDGRLFRSRHHNRPLSESTYSQVWRRARKQALPPAEFVTPLARRPYDLRHACVTTWLNAGVDPAQVSEWAGHSVAVLLRVYVRCITGRAEIAKKRIADALDLEGKY